MNLFIRTNMRKMEVCLHRLENLRMKNSPDVAEIGLEEVVWFYKGLTNEIHKLQSENDALKKEIAKANEPVETPNTEG